MKSHAAGCVLSLIIFFMSQKLKYRVKTAKQARHWSFASFVQRISLQALSSDLFMILGVFFVRYYEFNLKAQVKGASELSR